MNVIVHQAIRQQPKTKLLPVVSKPLEKSSPIGLIPKHRPAFVSTHDDVIKTPVHLEPQRPCHIANIPLSKTDPASHPMT